MYALVDFHLLGAWREVQQVVGGRHPLPRTSPSLILIMTYTIEEPFESLGSSTVQ